MQFAVSKSEQQKARKKSIFTELYDIVIYEHGGLAVVTSRQHHERNSSPTCKPTRLPLFLFLLLFLMQSSTSVTPSFWLRTIFYYRKRMVFRLFAATGSVLPESSLAPPLFSNGSLAATFWSLFSTTWRGKISERTSFSLKHQRILLF